MTPEERKACVGMWCDYRTVNGEVIQVIYRWEKDGMASVHDPKTLDERTNQYVMVRSLTPRFDMLRAWNPDGTPVEMEVEVSEVHYGRVSAVMSHIGVDFPEDTEVRRFVTEWEATDE